MRHVVNGFQHRPGIHCGSTAMSDALRTIGLDLTEEMALGLGAGPSFLLFAHRTSTPSRFFLGRTVSFEHDLCARLGVTFDERAVDGFPAAWKEIRAAIDDGRVVLALSDVRFLPYFGTRSHFNGHRVVIAGYDDDCALLADSHFPDLVQVSIADLERSMTSDVMPKSSSACVFGVLDRPRKQVDPHALVREAIHANAFEVLDAEVNALDSLAFFARDLMSWVDAPDAAWCARFAAQVIEKRGNGGGLFRRMYARFLHQAGCESLVPLAASAADAWSALADAFHSESALVSPTFERAAERAQAVVNAEEALWKRARAI